MLTQLIGSEDENDAAQFPIEMFVIIIFLDYHHILVLKIGVVIMLIGTYIPELDFLMEQDYLLQI